MQHISTQIAMSIFLGGKNRQTLVYFWVFQIEALSDPFPHHLQIGSPPLGIYRAYVQDERMTPVKERKSLFPCFSQRHTS